MQVRWRDVPVDDRPTDCFDGLAVCDKQFFPNIYALLHIFATRPVSTASAECTFSAMKLLKPYFRSTLSDENVLGLALAFIHKQMHVDIDEVINHLAIKTRQLQFRN